MSVILNNIRLIFYYIFSTGGSTISWDAGDLGAGTSASTTTITWANSLLGRIVSVVTDNPLLLIFVIFGLTFAAIGVFKRLTR